MDLLEYKAQEIFAKYGVPTMKNTVIDSADGIADKIKKADLTYPVVVKAQVQIGGRGKAGGVKFADNAEEAAERAKEILFMNIRGHIAKQLMIVEKADPVDEWYLSIMLDRLTKSPLLIFSPVGGMDIEQVAKEQPDKLAKVPIDIFTGVNDYVIEYAMDKTGADKKFKAQLKDIVEKLYKAFWEYNCMLLEINPIGVDSSDKLIALDGKVSIDDSALYKLPDILEFRDKLQEDDLVKEARSFRFHYVPLDEDGDIGIMSNGSGLMMSCIDLISKKGMKCGGGLDLGGGATAERIKEAVRIMYSNPKVHTLFICLFGGITRCDEVCGGVKMALEEQPAHKKVIIRMEGTNKELGIEIIKTIADRVTLVPGIPEAVEALWQLRQ